MILLESNIENGRHIQLLRNNILKNVSYDRHFENRTIDLFLSST